MLKSVSLGDRRSIALQGQTTIVLALVVGGLTLAALGVLRLRRVGFAAMPLQVAIASLVGGLAVIGFGAVLLLFSPGSEPQVTQEPLATLAPIDEVDERGPETGVAGRVDLFRGKPVEGTTVRLVPLFTEGDPKTLTAKTDATGRFDFPDVEINPGSPYVAEVTHENVTFASPRLRLPTDDLVLEIAQPTQSASGLTITAESVALVGDDAGLQAVHAISLTNRSGKAFVGGLRLPLLPGAAAIQEGPGLDRRDLELTDRSELISRTPIRPGTHEYTYTYVVPMKKDGIAVERDISISTRRFELLVGGSLAATDLGDLKRSGGVELAEKEYTRYVATDLSTGDAVSATVGVKAAPSPLRFGIPIALLLLAIAFVLLPMLRRKHRNQAEVVEAETQPV